MTQHFQTYLDVDALDIEDIEIYVYYYWDDFLYDWHFELIKESDSPFTAEYIRGKLSTDEADRMLNKIYDHIGVKEEFYSQGGSDSHG